MRAQPAGRALAVVLAATIHGGCYVASLSPLCDVATQTFDEALLGRWRSEEDRIELQVDRDGWGSYAVTWRDAAGEQRFTVRVTVIGSNRFFDATVPAGVDPGPALLPVHILGRVGLDGETLTLELVDYDWIAAHGRRGAIDGLAVTFADREVALLLSPSDRLRAWFGRHGATAGLFAEATTLQRVKSQVAAGGAPVDGAEGARAAVVSGTRGDPHPQ